MNSTFAAAFATRLAEIQRTTDDPTGPLGYGSDLSCRWDLDPATEVEGIEALGQALARRLDTPRGQLVDDPDYGFDLKSILNEGITTADLNSLSRRIRNELTKDDRVSMISVTVQLLDVIGRSIRVSIRIRPKESSETFAMTLAVTSAAVILEAIS